MPAEGAAKLTASRQELVTALKKADVFDPDRLIVHLSHVCNLEIGGQSYPVIDLRELVRGEVTPRGVNSILILGPRLKLAQRLDYAAERPEFCVGNRLYVWGDLWVETLGTQGNELTFDEQGHLGGLRHVEANDVPAWPPSSATIP
jgi:hypothetical protein